MDDPATRLSESLSPPSYEEDFFLSANLTIKNRLGLHARAAGKLVEAAKPFKSQVMLVKDGCHADVRSILSLISLGCPYNTEVVLLASGEDAAEALGAVSAVIENRFGES
ncbi:MAG: HPr family phosphocarrier protein [Deltaproteobacteria bacterium]|jgi:phosphocarrier protein|nr:HPr family phosphocarrier protein [Deltaproteobacteria bacterium]